MHTTGYLAVSGFGQRLRFVRYAHFTTPPPKTTAASSFSLAATKTTQITIKILHLQ